MTDHAAPKPSPKAAAGHRTARDVYWYRTTDSDRVPLCISCAYWRRARGATLVNEAVAARGHSCTDCEAAE